MDSYILTNRINQVRTKLKSVTTSFEITLNLKHGTKNRKTKTYFCQKNR